MSRLPVVLSLLFLLLTFAATGAYSRETALPDALRVCSDPNNLPYSNQAEQGFENKIAELIAADLKLDLQYTWFPQRMGFVRNTLMSWDEEHGRFRCDLIIGVPEGFDMSATTRTYYRSTYALVVKAEGPLADVRTPEQLVELPVAHKKALRIGAFSPSPSVNWLNKSGLFENTIFYQIMSADADYYPGKIIEDELIPGNLDVVLVWGPIAGYFAGRHPEADLRVIPMLNQSGFHFDFAMTMGLRRHETVWKKRIEKSLADNREAILNILQQYHIPVVDTKGAVLSAAGGEEQE